MVLNMLCDHIIFYDVIPLNFDIKKANIIVGFFTKSS